MPHTTALGTGDKSSHVPHMTALATGEEFLGATHDGTRNWWQEFLDATNDDTRNWWREYTGATRAYNNLCSYIEDIKAEPVYKFITDFGSHVDMEYGS